MMSVSESLLSSSQDREEMFEEIKDDLNDPDYNSALEVSSENELIPQELLSSFEDSLSS